MSVKNQGVKNLNHASGKNYGSESWNRGLNKTYLVKEIHRLNNTTALLVRLLSGQITSFANCESSKPTKKMSSKGEIKTLENAGDER
jgi:hypothetical protein